MMNSVGRTPTVIGQPKKYAFVMTIRARHIGGLGHGNYVQWHVSDMVSELELPTIFSTVLYH